MFIYCTICEYDIIGTIILLTFMIISAHLFILVGSNSDELCFFEHIRSECGVGKLQDVICSHQVKSRLILVH